MICRPPIVACPACNYPLTGLPTAHRCPECGFEYDEATIVFKPSRPWMTYVGTLGLAVVLLYFYAPIVGGLTLGTAGTVAASVVMFLIVAAPLAVLAWRIRRANRLGRFAALTKDGLFVRNIGGLTKVDWDDISTVAVNDMRPWLKRRSEEAAIGLHGILTTREEKRAFAEAIARGRGGEPPGIGLTPGDDDDAPKSTLSSRSRRLTRSGLVNLVISFVLMAIATLTTSPRNQWTAGALGVVAWIGIILVLTGLWQSDRR